MQQSDAISRKCCKLTAWINLGCPLRHFGYGYATTTLRYGPPANYGGNYGQAPMPCTVHAPCTAQKHGISCMYVH